MEGIDIQSILGFVVVGLVVGIVARLVVPNSSSMSLVATIVVGIIGAVVGGWLAGEVFPETRGVDWLASFLVAGILVFMLRGMSTGRSRRRSVL